VRKFRWGILGAGFAARKFVLGLRAAKDAEAVLAASRSLGKAREFAAALGITRSAGSYADAVRDVEVDAFYLATPPSTHRDLALHCLNAGKPVLVEKPFAQDAAAARDIVQAARARSVFCMEAMWTRFLPLVRRVKRMIEEGAAGEVRMFTGSFCTAEAVHPDSHVFSPQLGGGATLDRAVYPLSLAFHLLGRPEEITSRALIGGTDVDEDVAILLRYARGPLALIHASLRTQGSNDCVIMGTRAQIRVHAPIYRPFRMTITPIRALERTGKRASRMEAVRESHWVHAAYQRLDRIAAAMLGLSGISRDEYYAGNGYHYEAEEVMACVREGRLESAIMPLDQSLQIVEAMDSIRAQWGMHRRQDSPPALGA